MSVALMHGLYGLAMILCGLALLAGAAFETRVELRAMRGRLWREVRNLPIEPRLRRKVGRHG